MAQSMSSESGGFGAGFLDIIKGVGGLAIEYEKAKRVDVETKAAGNNIPDNADIVAGRAGQAASDSTGGVFKSPYVKLGLIFGGVVVGAVVLKKAKVI